VGNIFMAIEPLAGKRHVAITERKTCVDRASFIKMVFDEHYPDASRVVLVMDNLNTHALVSLYKSMEKEDARCLVGCLEIHYTSKHGSRPDMAEIEPSVLKGQCLDRRIGDMDTLGHEVQAWQDDRNNRLAP
jgi:hypothetical protein